VSASSGDLPAAVQRRRSYPRVTADAPSTAELLPLLATASTAADHGSLRPWRVIELRGDARVRLGEAFVEESGLSGADAERLAAKPVRASLLLAIVVSHKESFKVKAWEQDAAAAGIAHLLTLLLDDAGWGVMWRTGGHTRSAAVRRLHKLGDNEELLGWLYVGGKTADSKPDARAAIDPAAFISSI
jgi:nitroreductase